jgi:hypothetical protein
MEKLLLLFVITFLVSSCMNEEETELSDNVASDFVDYFYPTDSLIPFIYVFQDKNDPLNEKIHRIYRLENPSDTVLVVEHFNADFRITEGFSFDVNNFFVKDHMIVDGNGLKRKAKLTSNSFFPLSKNNQSVFISDFPSHLDSISMVFKSKKGISNADFKIEVLGEVVPAILVKDTVTVTLANVFTQQGSTQNVVIDRVYAKGFGLVQWSSSDGAIVYDLKKILSNKWWEEVAQSPQVK